MSEDTVVGSAPDLASHAEVPRGLIGTQTMWRHTKRSERQLIRDDIVNVKTVLDCMSYK